MSRATQLIVLSRGPSLYSTRRLVEASRAQGYKTRVVNPLSCALVLMQNKLAVHYRGKELRANVIVPRIGNSITDYGTTVVRQFEITGHRLINGSAAILASRNKLMCHQLLALAGVAMPDTVFGDHPDNPHHILDVLGPAPHVIKLISGTQGNGVMCTNDRKQSESTVEAFQQLGAKFIVQNFVAEAQGADIRAFVVGNRVVASMVRQAKAGEFRSNLHRGGSAKAIKLEPEYCEVAIKCAQTLGLEIAGVDILRTSNGPRVLEVNSSPGLEGIENYTGIDVAGEIIRHIELTKGD